LTVSDTNVDDLLLNPPLVAAGRIAYDGSPLPPDLTFFRNTSSVRIAVTPMSVARFTSVARDGTFVFTLSAGSSYQVRVDNLPFGAYVQSIRSGALDLMASSLLAEDHVKLKEIDVVLTKRRPSTEPEGVAVAGYVAAATGQTLPGDLSVELLMDSGLHGQSLPVEADGGFRFLEVPGGSYRISVYQNGMPLLGLPRNLPITVNETSIENLVLPVMAKVSVKGRVQLEDGNAPAPQEILNVRFDLTGGGYYSVPTETGAFGVTLIEGSYKVSLRDLPSRYSLKSISYGTADASIMLTIDPSRPAEELLITLRSAKAK
jgi:hypothetical protein